MEEQSYIASNPSIGIAWLGLTEAAEGVYLWDDGEVPGFTFWCNTEPNNQGDVENTGIINWASGGCWNDVDRFRMSAPPPPGVPEFNNKFAGLVELEPNPIRHYIYRAGDIYLAAPIGLVSPSGELAVCADGVEASQFRVKLYPKANPAAFGLRIAADPDGQDARRYGEVTSIDVDGDSALVFTYRHPVIAPTAYGGLVTRLELYNVQTGDVSEQAPFRILPAPVTLLHGWTGSPESMLPLQDFLVATYAPPVLVSNFDYEQQSVRRFSENRYIVPTAIRSTLARAWSAGIGASKSDLIGHSMGGCLARLYLQSAWGQSLGDYAYRGDVQRLITIDTPHAGSPGANCAMEMLAPEGSCAVQAALHPIAVLAEKIYEDTYRLPGYFSGGACDDLRVNSPGVAVLNGSATRSAFVPSRSEVCVSSMGQYLAQAGSTMQGIGMLMAFAAEVAGQPVESFVNRIRGGPAHDAIVPVVSQIGGNASIGGAFVNQGHSTAPGNLDVRRDVVRALAELQEGQASLFFTPAGYKRLTLSYPGLCVASPGLAAQGGAAYRTASVAPLVLPRGPITAVRGDSIAVTLLPPQGAIAMHVALIGAGARDSSERRPSFVRVVPPFTGVSLYVPRRTGQRAILLAVAYDGLGGSVLDTVEVNTALSIGDVTGIDLPDSALDLFVNTDRAVPAVLRLSGGAECRARIMAGVDYASSDEAVASVTGGGVIHAKSVGRCLVTVRAGLVVTEVAVRVHPEYEYTGPLLGVGPEAVGVEKALVVRPNPVRGGARAVVSGPVSLGENADVVDVCGRVVRELTGRRIGERMEFAWDGRARDLGRVSPGVYFVKTRGGQNRRAARIVVVN